MGMSIWLLLIEIEMVGCAAKSPAQIKITCTHLYEMQCLFLLISLFLKNMPTVLLFRSYLFNNEEILQISPSTFFFFF